MFYIRLMRATFKPRGIVLLYYGQQWKKKTILLQRDINAPVPNSTCIEQAKQVDWHLMLPTAKGAQPQNIKPYPIHVNVWIGSTLRIPHATMQY